MLLNMLQRSLSIVAQKNLDKMQLNFIEIHVYDHCCEVATQINTKSHQCQTDVEEHAFKKDQINNLISRQQCENCQQNSDR